MQKACILGIQLSFYNKMAGIMALPDESENKDNSVTAEWNGRNIYCVQLQLSGRKL